MTAPAFEDPAADAAWAFDGVIVDPSPEPVVESAGSRFSQLAYQRAKRERCRAQRICVRCGKPVEAGREAGTCCGCAQKISAALRERNGGRPWHCGFCGELGHNQRTCRMRLERGEPVS